MSSLPQSNIAFEWYLQQMERTGQRLKPAVDQFLGTVEALPSVKEHPAYLGRGGEGTVFQFPLNGEVHALKTRGVTEEIIKAHYRTAGKNGVPELRATIGCYSLGIMDLVPGKTTARMSAAERAQVPDEHIEGLFNIVVGLFEADASIEGGGENLMYDRNRGFGAIDIDPSQRSLQTQLNDTCRLLASFVIGEGKQIMTEKRAAGLVLAKRFAKLAADRTDINMDDIERITAYR